MKILHIWNTAGVGSIIAKYMDKTFGTESWVVMRKCFDKFGFTTYGECWDCGAKIFTLKALWMARRYDLVNVHSFDKIVPILRKIYPKKRVVLHYHGTDIRGKWRQKQKRKYWSKSDLIIVSTPDLLDGSPEGAVYLPNPVDTDFFYPKCNPKSETCFHISRYADDLAKNLAEQHRLEIILHNREENPVPHVKLAEVLSKHEYYVDVKRDKNQGRVIESLSKTALEALACGCKVIRWDGRIVKSLPPENRPEMVIEKAWKLYENLI